MHWETVTDDDKFATLAGFDVEKERSSLGLRLKVSAIETLFKFEPFFARATVNARKKIIDRSNSLGVKWEEHVDGMRRSMDQLEQHYENLLDPKVSETTPDYYRAPFHCYPEGNLCWQAALEVDPSAIAVHANIYTPKGEFERDGDDKLRSNFHRRMREMLRGPEPKDILDIGCSTGLSTVKLAETFPGARLIYAVDLSPHMLALGNYNLDKLEELKEARGRIEYHHAAGEVTGLADRSMDLVSLSLTSHELPAEATRNVFREAFRVLRSGGAISFMDMNPLAPAFQRLAANPFAFAGFKSTEPYLLQYISLDLRQELLDAGFKSPEVRSSSPRHRTCVAYVDK